MRTGSDRIVLVHTFLNLNLSYLFYFLIDCSEVISKSYHIIDSNHAIVALLFSESGKNKNSQKSGINAQVRYAVW